MNVLRESTPLQEYRDRVKEIVVGLARGGYRASLERIPNSFLCNLVLDTSSGRVSYRAEPTGVEIMGRRYKYTDGIEGIVSAILASVEKGARYE